MRWIYDFPERVVGVKPMALEMGRRALRQDWTSADTVHNIFKKNDKSESKCVLRLIHGYIHFGEYFLKNATMTDRIRRPVE